MFRIFILLVILWIAWVLARRHFLNPYRNAQSTDPMEQSNCPPTVPLVKTVQCAHCGLHLPEVEAISGPHGFYYCCREHQQLGLPDESRP